MSTETLENTQGMAQLLKRGCQTAHALGNQLDLSCCYYGKVHSKNATTDFCTVPSNYYFFLAGFIRQFCCLRVLEIGTHYGGAIKAMLRGVPNDTPAANVKFCTMDITHFNEEGFQNPPDNQIFRVKGDACHPLEFKKAYDFFGKEPIDLLFIDADHRYEPTAEMINIYTHAFSPKYLILDDIHLNESMDKLWADLVETLGVCAVDVTEVGKRGESGLGVCLLRY